MVCNKQLLSHGKVLVSSRNFGNIATFPRIKSRTAKIKFHFGFYHKYDS